MNIQGFQKMTLLDFPGNVAATVFTGGCNFRCPFCHNASIVLEKDPSLFDEKDVLDYLTMRAKMLDGVCITGGEPLLNRDISVFIKKIKDLGLKVKLDTNGSFPDVLENLIDEGLIDYAAVDIKNSKEKYNTTIGAPNFSLDKIDKTIALLKQGKIDYEFRTTVVKEFHDLEDMEKIGMWLKGDCKYFIQSFKDSGDLICDGLHAHDKNILHEMLSTVKKHLPNAQLRGIE